MDWIKELVRVQASTRFNVFPERVLIGKFESKIRIGKAVLEYFKNRYPTFYIILQSNQGVFHGSKMLKLDVNTNSPEFIHEVRRKAVVEIQRLGLFKVDSIFNKELWNEYYNSQYIPARKNLNAQKTCFGTYKIPELKEYVNKKENKSLNKWI